MTLALLGGIGLGFATSYVIARLAAWQTGGNVLRLLSNIRAGATPGGHS
jgi:hypothetical protein